MHSYNYNDPDFFEIHEQDYLVNCDICKKEKLHNEVNAMSSIEYNSSILICESCFTKLEKGENLAD